MSILVAAAGADTGGLVFSIAFPLVACAIAWAVGGWAGLFRAESLAGPERVPPDRPVWPLVLVLASAVGVWLVAVPGFYFAVVQAMGRPIVQPDSATGNALQLTPRDLLVLGMLGPAVGYVVLLLGDGLVYPRVRQRFGYAPRRAPKAALIGSLAAVAIVPLVLATSGTAETVYKALHWEHPPEHDLLKAMGESGRGVRVLLILTAVVVAPVWEEMLFRGHLQTILRATFAGTRRRGAGEPRGFEVVGVPPQGLPPPPPPGEAPVGGSGPGAVPIPPPLPVNLADPGVPDTPAPASDPRAATRHAWIAIVLTSVAFALVHDMWTWPPIFVLSLGLGWVYERTGNLWVPTVLHALFNGFSTVVYLLYFTGGPH